MQEDTSALMVPDEVKGTVTDVRIDHFDGDFGPKVSLELEMSNPHFENPFKRSWSYKKDDEGRIKRGCILARMVLRPLNKLGAGIVDFKDLKGLILTLKQETLEWDIDGEHVETNTWKVIKVGEDDTEEAENDEKESEPEPKPKAKKDEAVEEEDEEEADEADEESEDLGKVAQSILTFLGDKPKRKFKKENVVAHVLNEGIDVDDNDVEEVLKELKKAKKVREPKFGHFQAV